MTSALAFASISARLASAAFTLSASAFAFSNKAAFSSPFAAPTDFESVFCSARRVSNSVIAARRTSATFL